MVAFIPPVSQCGEGEQKGKATLDGDVWNAPPLVLGAIAGAGELAFSRSCESAREWALERDPGSSCAGPRAKELVPEESFSVNMASRF